MDEMDEMALLNRLNDMDEDIYDLAKCVGLLTKALKQSIPGLAEKMKELEASETKT